MIASYTMPAPLPWNPNKKTNIEEKTCQVCGFFSSSRSDARRHAVLHLGQEEKEKLMVSCSFCNYKTLQKSNMKAHERRHTGEKPYQCNFCLAPFRDGSTLSRHRHVCHSNPQRVPRKSRSGKTASVRRSHRQVPYAREGSSDSITSTSSSSTSTSCDSAFSDYFSLYPYPPINTYPVSQPASYSERLSSASMGVPHTMPQSSENSEFWNFPKNITSFESLFSSCNPQINTMKPLWEDAASTNFDQISVLDMLANVEDNYGQFNPDVQYPPSLYHPAQGYQLWFSQSNAIPALNFQDWPYDNAFELIAQDGGSKNDVLSPSPTAFFADSQGLNIDLPNFDLDAPVAFHSLLFETEDQLSSWSKVEPTGGNPDIDYNLFSF